MSEESGDLGAATDTDAGVAKNSLEEMRKLVSSGTTIIASWLVALAAFGFFGFGQRYWQLHYGRERLSEAKVRISELKDSIERNQRRVLRFTNRYVAEDVAIAVAPGAWHEGDIAQLPIDDTLHRLRTGPYVDLEECAEVSAAISTPLKDTTPTATSRSGGRPGMKADQHIAISAIQEAKAICKVIEQEQARLKDVESEYRKQYSEFSEIPLKTPLFETTVLTNMAPMAELVLLLLFLCYLRSKRREVLRVYAQAADDAGLFDPVGENTDPIAGFNDEVRRKFGGVPLWLLPFPLTGRGFLPQGLRVADTLGRDARDAMAWLKSLLLVFVMLVYGAYLFSAATSLDIASKFKQPEDSSSIGDIDFSFLLNFLLTTGVIFISISMVVPWNPRRSPEQASVSRSQRRLVLAAVPLMIAGLPLAVLLTDRTDAVLRVLPPSWRRKAGVLRRKPRFKSMQHKQRKVGHWVTVQASSAGPFVENGFVALDSNRQRHNRPLDDYYPVHYVFPGRLHGKEGAQLHLAFRGRVPPAEYLVSVRGDHLQNPASQDCGVTVHKKFRSTLKRGGRPPGQPQKPRVAIGTASISMEAAALETLRQSKDAGAALALLEHGIRVIRASSRCDDIRGALRLYDLAFILAMRAGAQEVQNRLLADLRAVQKARVGGHASPVTNGARRRRRSKPRHRWHSVNPIKADQADYLSSQIASRLEKWSDPHSKWSVKWKRDAVQWKTSYASKSEPRRTEVYTLPN